MTTEVLYRKWRPSLFRDVVGQELVTTTLRNAVAMSRVSHAYLFHGPRGTGKTSTARILAKAVNCLAPQEGEPCDQCHLCIAALDGKSLDIIEIDAASNRGIADIKDVIEKMHYAPTQGQFKTYIIDEVHQLTSFASDALLKTLEEPPPHALLILATTDPEAMPITITSRCQQFSLVPLSTSSIVSRLQVICDAENIEAESTALEKIAQSSSGSLRDAENLLEQAHLTLGNHLNADNISSGLSIGTDMSALDLAASALNGDIATGLQLIQEAHAQGRDINRYERSLVNYLRTLMKMSSGVNSREMYSETEITRMTSIVNSHPLSAIHTLLRIFTTAINEQYEDFPTLGLELALVSATLNSEPAYSTKVAFPEKSGFVPTNQTNVSSANPADKSTTANTWLSETKSTSPPLPEETPSSTIAEQPPPPQALTELWNLLTDEFKGQKGKKKSVDLGGLLRTSQNQQIINNELVLIYKYSSNRDWLLNELDDPATRVKLEEATSRLFGVSKVKAVTQEELQPETQHTSEGHLISLAQQLGGHVVSETTTKQEGVNS